MVEIFWLLMVWAVGGLMGVVALSQYDAFQQRRRLEELAAARSLKRIEARQKAVATRKAKSVAKVEDGRTKVDPNMYGRKANGESTWAG